MKMNKKTIMLFSGLLLTACVTHSTTNSLTLKMPEPEAEAVWKHISQESSFTEWPFWEDGKGITSSTNSDSYSPNHRVYINKQALSEERIPFPNESILVSYIRSPAGEPKAVTVMYKVKGYNPAAGDWFWAKYSLTGEVEEAGKIQRCISCHARKIPNNDYIASTSLKKETSSAPAATTTPRSTSVATGNPTLNPAAMLTAHNQWRSKTGVPALKWSNELAGSSQKWADQLAQNGCKMKHSTGKYGENIYWAGAAQRSDGTSSVQKKTDQDAVDAWGNEVQDYDYASNTCHGVCGHYTQVVWKSTSEVGCAMTVCSDKGQLWVCQYTSRGNMVGEKPY
jgi:pathogenesis-related protein 1